MREKYLWLVIAVLTALSLGQACYICERPAAAGEVTDPPRQRAELLKMGYSEKASDAQWEEFQRWRDRLQGRLDSGTPLLEPDFDAFFNDKYFSMRQEPFSEMEGIRKQLSDNVGQTEKPLFDSYWEKWFEQRMKMGQFRTELVRAGSEITLTIQVPGLAAGTAGADISGGRIKVSFSAKALSEQKGRGSAIVSESSQDYVKILPVPEDADAATGKVEISANRVTISFKQKKGRN